MKITFLGTTTLLLDDGADQLLFDCHITRPSMLKYLLGRLKTDAAMAERVIARHHIDRLRAIFVSHAHHDHVMDAPYFAVRCGAAVHGSPSALNVARGGGVPETRLHAFDPATPVRVNGFTVRVLPSLHSKARWYNDDLGRTIDAPLVQPAPRRRYREGGSFDFLVEHGGRTLLIRPSFNYIEGQLDGIRADALFLGVAGLAGADAATRDAFFRETVDKVRPSLVVPVHWDNFFVPLDRPNRGMPRIFEDTAASLSILAECCAARGIPCSVLLPGTSIDFG